jgi:hypothetical protein
MLALLLAQAQVPSPETFSGWNGFLGTRASFMLDVVVLAMLAVLPLLAWSIYLVKYRHQYALHKKMQLILAGLLLVAVGAFEVDMRFITDWEERAAPSPYYVAGQWDAVWGSSGHPSGVRHPDAPAVDLRRRGGGPQVPPPSPPQRTQPAAPSLRNPRFRRHVPDSRDRLDLLLVGVRRLSGVSA